MRNYFGVHNHTMYSNIRLLDSINRPKDLIDKAIELGLSGIAITDHESLGAHVEVNKYAEEIYKEHPDFVIALGNEIYLINMRGNSQKYYHFILIAKDALGHRALRELSSTAWYYSYEERRQERVPTEKSELKQIVEKYKGHLIATTACIGGELPSLLLKREKSVPQENLDNFTNELLKIDYDEYTTQINDFMELMINLFGDDFYIECAPSNKEDQILANQLLKEVATEWDVKMVVGTDAHYLTKEHRAIHKAYLTSKEGEREVDEFYEFARLMDSDEVEELLNLSFSKDLVQKILDNTLEIQGKIERYSLFHKQDIPEVPVKDYTPSAWWGVNNDYADDMKHSYPTLSKLFTSKDPQDRYWVNENWDKLNEINKGWVHACETGDYTYLDRLEEEARVKSIISEKLETNMFRYPNTLQHYIDLIWDCGSMVGAGRGSSCAALNHYLMGITQLDPIEWDLPFFRYLNEERVELGDIDIDICPSKRPLILQKIKEERGQWLITDQEWAKENLGCTLIATYGTEGSKSAIQTACRGYRSEDYPNGIDVDDARYMASLIPEERGFNWTIKETYYGNKDKERRPVAAFVKEVDKYPGLLEIILEIEGLVNHRGSHASGVILFNGDPFEHSAFMKTPKGEVITQYDLHDAEYMGLTKYDFLVTEVQDKLVQTIELMQYDGVLPAELSLREIYDQYLHPNVIPLKDQRIWDALANVSVINTFQFDSLVGAQAARKIAPQTVLEMADANGLMRLMGEEGEMRPLDKYVRNKNNIDLWYREMDNFGLTKDEQSYLEPYFLKSYGVPPSQEQLMTMLMDENICNFSLGEANAARKIVGKKQMSKIPELHNKVLERASSRRLGEYVWKYGAGPQMGYSFSIIHALAYSFIGVQTLYIATNWNPIYWNTACLIVNSGATDPENGGQTDYSKIAKAMGEIMAAGINMSLVDINSSDYGFLPDAKNNRILYGMKAMLNVGDDVIDATIANRPYSSPKDFYQRVHPKKPAMISLIKGGAFDEMMDRKQCMAWFIYETCDKKSRLTLQNLPTLMKRNMLPIDTEERRMAKRIYEFTRYLKAKCRKTAADVEYNLDDRAIAFLDEIDFNNRQAFTMNVKAWDKYYQDWMDVFREWIKEDKDQILQTLNDEIFLDDWKKYADGTISHWEMEALCFYYHEHELAHLNKGKYGIVEFEDLPENPVIENTFARGGKIINMFKLSKICGTCIAKNKVKSTVSLLTTSGVVTVKFRKEYFALFDKQISQRGSDGVKHVVEKSWFNRGSMIMVMGIRSEDNFIAKKYASSGGHQLYKITEIDGNGDIILQTERASGIAEEE